MDLRNNSHSRYPSEEQPPQFTPSEEKPPQFTPTEEQPPHFTPPEEQPRDNLIQRINIRSDNLFWSKYHGES